MSVEKFVTPQNSVRYFLPQNLDVTRNVLHSDLLVFVPYVIPG